MLLGLTQLCGIDATGWAFYREMREQRFHKMNNDGTGCVYSRQHCIALATRGHDPLVVRVAPNYGSLLMKRNNFSV